MQTSGIYEQLVTKVLQQKLQSSEKIILFKQIN